MKTPFREIIVALVIGAAVGWFAAVRLAPERPHGSWKKGQMLERFSRELSLSPEQRQKVAKVLEAKRAQFEALREEARPRFDAVRASSQDEIRRVLDPAQIEKFEKMESEAQARRREKHGPGRE
jgi:Spy/CpxP family protein refolding chaperone